MPREASITYEEVLAIAESIKAAGGKPNPRQIRERHGSGSLCTIHRLFQQWEAGQDRRDAGDAPLPATLRRALLDFVAHEVAGARAELADKLAEAQAAANDLATENERQARHVAALEGITEALHGEKATLAGKVAQLETDLDASRDDAARERLAAEAARTDVAKATLRLEAIPVLEKENERLQHTLDNERAAHAEAERRTAAAEARAAGLTERLADTQQSHARAVASLEDRLHDYRNRSTKLEAALTEMHTETRHLTAQLARATGELDALRGQLLGQQEAGNRAPAHEAATSRS